MWTPHTPQRNLATPPLELQTSQRNLATPPCVRRFSPLCHCHVRRLLCLFKIDSRANSFNSQASLPAMRPSCPWPICHALADIPTRLPRAPVTAGYRVRSNLALGAFLCNETKATCTAWASRAAAILRTFFISNSAATLLRCYADITAS